MDKYNPKSRYLEGGGFIDPKTLPVNALGYRECRYCHESVLPPRRTFCSDKCIHEYRLRTDGTYLRECVFKRDNGICSICDTDTKVLAKELDRLHPADPLGDILRKEHNISKSRKVNLYKLGGGLWDADHILPVKDGGGCSGLENLRTLCIGCHKLITFKK